MLLALPNDNEDVCIAVAIHRAGNAKWSVFSVVWILNLNFRALTTAPSRLDRRSTIENYTSVV